MIWIAILLPLAVAIAVGVAVARDALWLADVGKGCVCPRDLWRPDCPVHGRRSS